MPYATACSRIVSVSYPMMEHAAVFVRTSSGLSSTVSEGGDTTANSPLTVGLQVNIPLSSPKEQREYTQHALAKTTRINEVCGRVLSELAKLRQELEAERTALAERLAFYRSKADWVQERTKKSYEDDIDKLWEAAQKQNSKAADLRRLDVQIRAQRRHITHAAGEHWQPLLDYLSNTIQHLLEDS